MTDVEEPVTQTTSSAAGPYAHIDPEAQAEVQKELNLRIARDTRMPVKPVKVPPGLSPNQLIALAQAGALPQQDEETEKDEDENEHPPED